MAKTANTQVKFKIHSIREVSFFYSEITEDMLGLIGEKDAKNIKYTFNTNFSWNFDENIFGILLEAICFIDLPEHEIKKIDLLKHKTLAEFKIENLNEFLIITEAKEFQMNPGLLSTLVSIIISTARGMIVSRTQGSWINKFYVPIMNPKEFVDDILPRIKVNT